MKKSFGVIILLYLFGFVVTSNAIAGSRTYNDGYYYNNNHYDNRYDEKDMLLDLFTILVIGALQEELDDYDRDRHPTHHNCRRHQHNYYNPWRSNQQVIRLGPYNVIVTPHQYRHRHHHRHDDWDW